MAESRITEALEDGEARNPIKGLFKDLEVRSLDEIAKEVMDSLKIDLSSSIAIARNKAEDLEDDFGFLTEDERAILTLYTMENKEKREDSFYYQINEALRARDRDKIMPWRNAIWLLLTSMNKLPRCQRTGLYRGVRKAASELGKQCKENKTFLWCGFSSTAEKSEGVKSFLGKDGPRTLWTLQLRKDFFGVSLVPFSLFPTEHEVLLPPQMNFKVISVLDCGHGLTMVQCEQVPELDPILDFTQASEPSAATAAAVPAATRAATSEGPDVGSTVSAAPAAKAKASTPEATTAAAPAVEAAMHRLPHRRLVGFLASLWPCPSVAATAASPAAAAATQGLGQSASAPSLAGHAGAALRKAKPAEAAEAAEPAKASADASATLAASVKAWDEPKESKEAKLPAADPDIKVPAAATIEELLRPRALTTTIEHAHDKQWVMAICPVDGEMFATVGSDSALRLWRLGATGPEAVRAMKGHGDTVVAVAKVSPEVICTGSHDRTAKLWQVSSGRSLATLQGHTNSVWAVAALHPELLATGSYDHTVKLWQLPGGTCSATLNGHKDFVLCLATVTPELLVSGSDDRTVRLWDVAKAQSLGTWRGHETGVFALAALGGSTVASGSGDKTVKTWDVATGSNVLTLRGHGGAVCALQPLHPQVLASGGGDKSVRIWDLRSGECAQVLQGHTNEVNGLALMGKVLLSCGDDGTIRAWT